MMPRATVVIASFSSIGQRALDSLDRQSLPPSELEIIIVPEAGDTKARERITQLADNRPNVRVHECEKSGSLGARRQAGASAASGEYLLFLDDEVSVGKNALERLCSFASEASADICFGKTSRKGPQPGLATATHVNMPSISKQLAMRFVLDSAKIIRRDFVEKAGLRFDEDLDQQQDIGFDLDAIASTEAICSLGDYPAFTDGGAVASVDAAAGQLQAVSRSTAPDEFQQLARLEIHRHQLGLLLSSSDGRNDLAGDASFDAYRDAATAHVPVAVDEQLGRSHRALATALREGDIAGAVRIVDGEQTRLTLRDSSARWIQGNLEVTLTVLAPASGQPHLCLCVVRPDGTEWLVSEDDVVVAPDPQSGDLRITGLIRPGLLAAGKHLPQGVWSPAVRIVEEGTDRREKIPYSRACAGVSFTAGNPTVCFNDGGHLAIDVGAARNPFVPRLDADRASVSEDHRGSLLRVELPQVDFPHDAELSGRIRIGDLPVPAKIRTVGEVPVLEAWVSGLSGSHPLATKFSDAPFALTGLALEIDGVGRMTTRVVNRQSRPKPTPTKRSKAAPQAVSRPSSRLRQAIKRVPGTGAVYRRVRGAGRS